MFSRFNHTSLGPAEFTHIAMLTMPVIGRRRGEPKNFRKNFLNFFSFFWFHFQITLGGL